MAKVMLVCGRICCGKTTYAHMLRRQERAVLLSCDEIMLSVLDEYLGGRHDAYAARTQQYLLHKSLELLETGISVILDWGPWTKEGRRSIKAYYAEHGFACETHAIRVNETEWLARIEKRNALVEQKEYQAYRVDEGLMSKFLSRYEETAADEADVWIDG